MNISKEFNWYDRNGEVLTAAFLACDDLDKTTIDEIRKYMIEEVNKILNNKEIRRYLDLMYILFGLAYKSDPEVVSLMNRIWKNEALLDYLKFDPETLSLYFFCLFTYGIS
ncbi:MAG: hypothetical protein QXU11_06320 [Thermoproteota archaeon]